MHSESGIGAPESTSFAQSLEELKRRGSNILVVGTTDREPHETACRRLLGRESPDELHRLVVTTDPNSVEPADEGGCSEETRYIVLAGDETRRSYPTSAVIETRMLGMLGTKFVEAVNDVEDERLLAPSELRVCVDSVSVLLRSYDVENVFRLLHVMTTRIRQCRGMGHYHLPVERDEEAVRLFEPLFDAVVELRPGPEDPEHRWHLRDRNVPTDWIAI